MKSWENCWKFSFCTLVCTGQSFFVEKTTYSFAYIGERLYPFFYKKRPTFFYGAKLTFRSFATFFGLTIIWSGAKQRFCFTGCRSVWNQTARIWALDFLARWQLTSYALYYNLPYIRDHYLEFWMGRLFNPRTRLNIFYVQIILKPCIFGILGDNYLQFSKNSANYHDIYTIDLQFNFFFLKLSHEDT